MSRLLFLSAVIAASTPAQPGTDFQVTGAHAAAIACREVRANAACASPGAWCDQAQDVVCQCRSPRSGLRVMPPVWQCEARGCATATAGAACEPTAPRCKYVSCVDGVWAFPPPPP